MRELFKWDSGGGGSGGAASILRQIIAGLGLFGGGDLSDDITINVGEGPGIDVTEDAVGLGGDTILLYHSNLSPVAEFTATDDGLTAALATATNGDEVLLPICEIAGGPWTIPSNISLRGQSRYSYLNGTITNNGLASNFEVSNLINIGTAFLIYATPVTGNGIEQTAAGVIEQCYIQVGTSATYGIDISDGYLFDTIVGTNGGSTNTGVYIHGANVEVNNCRFAGYIGGKVEQAYIIGDSEFYGSDLSSGSYGMVHSTSGVAILSNCNFICSSGASFGAYITDTGLTLTDCNWNSISGLNLITYGTGDRSPLNHVHATGGGLEGIFNVKDIIYGAVGDGTTDDTIAVQAAIDAANINGGDVYLPPGVYSCDPLTFYNNTNIFGAGMNLSTIKARSSGILLYSSYFSNGELQDFQLDGNSTGTTGLKIDGSCWITGRRLRIHDFTDKDLHLHGILISSFYDCFFTDSAYGTYGEIGTSDQEANLVLFENCTWRDNSTRGIYWTRGDQLILISPNIEHCGTAEDTSTGGIYFSGEVEGIGLNIKDGWFESNYGGENIKIDTPYYPNNTSIITDTMFVSNTDLVYGIYLNGASSPNKLICRGVNFYDDAATTDYESNGSFATIYLNRCTGTTAGTGAIIDDSTSTGFNNPMTTIGDIIVETATGGSENVALTSLGASATANQYQTGHEPGISIDGDDGTYWHSNHSYVNDDWITIDLGSSQEIKGFRILQYPVAANDASTCPIYSSPNNSSWTLVETASFNTYPTCETLGNFPSPVTARYFKFAPSAGGSGGWAIQTIELYAPLPGPDRLGIGDENDVLTVVSGIPSWGPPGAGSGVKQTIFTFPGILAISDNPLRIYNKLGSSQTISQVFISVGTAPVGDSVIVDIHKNGTTIFTNQAHRPVITTGNTTGYTTTIDIPSWADGDYLTAHVDNIGSTIPGSDLVVHIVTTGPAGGGSNLLAVHVYAPASIQIYTITSTSMDDVDATNLAITFTAPASGNILVRLSAWSDITAGGDAFWGLREGTADLSGSIGRVLRMSGGEQSFVCYSFYLTGISAGSHTYKWSAGGQNPTTSRIIIQDGSAIAKWSPALMEVWACP